jgi:hypothetical protein
MDAEKLAKKIAAERERRIAEERKRLSSNGKRK